MAVCSQCASPLPTGAKFCGECAAPVNQVAPSSRRGPGFIAPPPPRQNLSGQQKAIVAIGVAILVALIVGGLLTYNRGPGSWEDALNDVAGQSGTSGTVSACHRAAGLKPDNNNFAYSQVYARCKKVGVAIP